MSEEQTETLESDDTLHIGFGDPLNGYTYDPEEVVRASRNLIAFIREKHQNEPLQNPYVRLLADAAGVGDPPSLPKPGAIHTPYRRSTTPEILTAARAVIADVRSRHQGEALTCPYMVSLAEAVGRPEPIVCEDDGTDRHAEAAKLRAMMADSYRTGRKALSDIYNLHAPTAPSKPYAVTEYADGIMPLEEDIFNVGDDPSPAPAPGTHAYETERRLFAKEEPASGVDQFGSLAMTRLRRENSRTYHYNGGVELRFDDVTHLHVTRRESGDSHRLRTANGDMHYVKPGWLAITFHGLEEWTL